PDTLGYKRNISEKDSVPFSFAWSRNSDAVQCVISSPDLNAKLGKMKYDKKGPISVTMELRHQTQPLARQAPKPTKIKFEVMREGILKPNLRPKWKQKQGAHQKLFPYFALSLVIFVGFGLLAYYFGVPDHGLLSENGVQTAGLFGDLFSSLP